MRYDADNPEHQDVRVLDASGAEIADVRWVDTDAGEFCRFVRDPGGNLVDDPDDPGECLTEVVRAPFTVRLPASLQAAPA
jgi:hypothetical protein